MKLYKREIKPMINPGSFYGVKWDLIPVRDFDNWYPEEREEELAKALNINDPYDILVFEERFVEVEFGTCKNCNHGECRHAGVWCHIFEIYMGEENFCNLYWNGED
jgi:hypothetical protein